MAYYYIKDCVILPHKEDNLIFSLKNNYGIIDLKFPNEEKMKKWLFHLNEMIDRMRYAYDAKAKELEIINKSRKIDSELVYFGMEINIKDAYIHLFNEEKINSIHPDSMNNSSKFKKLFELILQNLRFKMNLREFDSVLKLYIRDFIIFDYYNENDNKIPKLILKSQNKLDNTSLKKTYDLNKDSDNENKIVFDYTRDRSNKVLLFDLNYRYLSNNYY